MKKKTANLLGGLVFLILAVGGYAWLWSSSLASDTPTVVTNYPQVNIESVKQDALNLTTDLVKVSDIPVVVPSDKIGRSNPFENY